MNGFPPGKNKAVYIFIFFNFFFCLNTQISNWKKDITIFLSFEKCRFTVKTIRKIAGASCKSKDSKDLKKRGREGKLYAVLDIEKVYKDYEIMQTI
jgi:hypothetical protein